MLRIAIVLLGNTVPQMDNVLNALRIVTAIVEIATLGELVLSVMIILAVWTVQSRIVLTRSVWLQYINLHALQITIFKSIR